RRAAAGTGRGRRGAPDAHGRPRPRVVDAHPEPDRTRVMRRIAPLILTLIAACGTTTAAAFAQAPATDSARLARFLPIARAAWPGSPCAGRENVHLGGDLALRAAAPAVAGPGESLNAMAEPQTCEVWLASELSARTFCTVLVHEFGH